MTGEQNVGNYFVSWSGGKDSCLAMSRLIATRGKPTHLLTMLDEKGTRSRGHHLPLGVLRSQAAALGAQLITRRATWDGYEVEFVDALGELKALGTTEGVFGDIDLAEHREWVERVCAGAGTTPHEPLWLEGRLALLDEFLDSGYQAILVAIKDGSLSPGLLGRALDRSLVEEFVAAGIDPSGELGEYHTLVVDGPEFSHRVDLEICGTVEFDGYRFLDVAAAN